MVHISNAKSGRSIHIDQLDARGSCYALSGSKKKKAQLSLWSHLPGFVPQITVDPREFNGDKAVGEE